MLQASEDAIDGISFKDRNLLLIIPVRGGNNPVSKDAMDAILED